MTANFHFSRSHFHPSWIEIRENNQVVQEIEIAFPLKQLPNIVFLTLDEALQWLKTIERKMAKNQALRFLARQALASSMLFRKLQDKGYCKEVCREVIDDCRQYGYLPDEQVWPRLVERELEKGYGPRWIEWKWKAKGLPDGLVAAIATAKRQREAIRKILQKQKKSESKKIAQVLLRRGFEMNLILQEIEIF